MPETPLDCRGLSCPQPLMRCKAVVEQYTPSQITVLVDSESSRENVARFLASQGYAVGLQAEKGYWLLTGEQIGLPQGREQGPRPDYREEKRENSTQKVVVLVTSQTLGQGEESLGRRLLANFLSLLPEFGPDLWRVLLLNSGVKLAVEEGPALDALQRLAQDGVKVLACGTCLEQYGLMGQLEIGETTTMLDVVTSLQLADKVLTP